MKNKNNSVKLRKSELLLIIKSCQVAQKFFCGMAELRESNSEFRSAENFRIMHFELLRIINKLERMYKNG